VRERETVRRSAAPARLKQLGRQVAGRDAPPAGPRGLPRCPSLPTARPRPGDRGSTRSSMRRPTPHAGWRPHRAWLRRHVRRGCSRGATWRHNAGSRDRRGAGLGRLRRIDRLVPGRRARSSGCCEGPRRGAGATAQQGAKPGTVTLVLVWLLGGEPTHISVVIYRDQRASCAGQGGVRTWRRLHRRPSACSLASAASRQAARSPTASAASPTPAMRVTDITEPTRARVALDRGKPRH
jgi:hypothetical protein